MCQNAQAACGEWSGAGTQNDPFVATAANATQPEVQACVDAISTAQSGYVQINIPSGEVAYSGTERLTVDTSVSDMNNVTHLNIKGAGTDNTIITNNVQSVFAYTTIYILPSRDNILVTISDISFEPGTNYGQWGFIYVRRTNNTSNIGWHSFRITRCSFGGPQSAMIHISGDLYGLIDNNTFTGSSNVDVITAGAGISTWEKDLTLGSEDAVFVENNTFVRTDSRYFNINGIGDGNGGARAVFRYNDVVNSRVGNFHGNESQPVSMYSTEIYNNKFTLNSGNISTVFSVRGGTSLVYNNELNGSYPALGDLQNYRSCPSFYGTHTGQISSTTMTDSNLTARCGGYGFNGVPAGSQNDPYCISASAITTSYYINNQTTGAWCNVASWTDDAITCGTSLPYGPMQSGMRNEVEDNTWQTGDVYAVFFFRNDNGACDGLRDDVDGDGENGYPCSQQAGQVFGSLDSNTQARFPVYGWNNKQNGTTTDTWTVYGIMCAREANVLQINRDFFNRAPQVGDEGYAYYASYSQYTCPHRLAGTGSCDDGVAGTQGYNIISDDTIAPASPTGLAVQ